MKTTTTLFILFVSTLLQAQTWAEYRAIKAWSVISADETSISIHWLKEKDKTTFTVYRKSDAEPLSQLAQNLTDSFFVDNTIAQGKKYEYVITSNSTKLDPYYSSSRPILASSEISTGVRLPLANNRGRILLIITKKINDSLSNKIEILKQDLISDGWETISYIAQDLDSVKSIKAIIDSKYAEQKSLSAVYLLGHIPVPYSGQYCNPKAYNYPPDGHDSAQGGHCGAWASDVYYGVINGTWTDELTVINASREANKNRPGDGKFDNNDMPGTVVLAVGRVDFSNLSQLTSSEVALTGAYLDKVHAFKNGQTAVLNKGVISDNFPGIQEGFSSAAIRDFSALVGASNVEIAKLDEVNTTDNYLLGYGCGAGGYSSCSGVGKTTDFNTKSYSVFNHLFGSYFGDFDVANNYLRASLGAPKNNLVSFWSGRPKWHTHILGTGATIGECAVKSQNNKDLIDISFFSNQTHMALMGDPSLRLHPVATPTNISAQLSDQDTTVTLTWTASTSPGVMGYNIYISQKADGDFVLLNKELITFPKLIHTNPFPGTMYYLIKAIKLEQTTSGSYYNASLSPVIELKGIKGVYTDVAKLAVSNFKVYPNPAHNTLRVKANISETRDITIVNTLGQEVLLQKAVGKEFSIDISSLQNGVYWLMLDHTVQKFTKN